MLLQGMPGMAFMMDAYEQELKRPIRNVVNGQLPRTLLIQVHPGLSTMLFDRSCLKAGCHRFLWLSVGSALQKTDCGCIEAVQTCCSACIGRPCGMLSGCAA